MTSELTHRSVIPHDQPVIVTDVLRDNRLNRCAHAVIVAHVRYIVKHFRRHNPMSNRWGCISLAAVALVAVLGFVAFFAEVL